MLKLATKIEGNCSACGTVLDAGDWFDPDVRVHAECRDKRRPERVNTEPASGFLFGDMAPAGTKHISFDGSTVLGIDTPRLSAQLARVFNLMRDSRFRTLSEIAAVAGCLETSASARLRDFRKARFGGHTVVSRRVANLADVYEYRLIVKEKAGSGRRNAA